MLGERVKTEMLVKNVRHTGDGVHQEGSIFVSATTNKCPREDCELVELEVVDSDCIKGKSNVIARCGSPSCWLGEDVVKSCIEMTSRLTPDELKPGPDVGNSTNLVVDDSKR